MRIFVLIAGCLFAAVAWAAAGPVALSAADSRIDLAGNMAMLRDGDRRLGPDEAAIASGWQDLPGNLNAGFTADAIWLRVDLDRRPGAPSGWLLELSNALLDDVRLYERVGTGWRERRSGEDVARAQWEIDYRNAVFRLDLAEVGQHTLWLRLTTRNAFSTQVLLWQPAAFGAATRIESLGYGMLFGAYLMIFAFYVVFWLWTREAVSNWYLWYVLNNLVQMTMTYGFAQQYLRLPGRISDPLLAVLLCSSLWIIMTFCTRLLDLATAMPRTERVLTRMAAVLSATFVVLALTVSYAAGVAPAQMVSLPLIVVLIGVAIHLWRQGHQAAGFFLVAFGIFFAGIILRFARNLGYLPPGVLTDNSYQVGAIIHMVVMSLGVAGHYNRLKREKDEAQTEALRVKTNHAIALESEVGVRTSWLVDEISRREALERELRLALDVERQARREQRDFVAMVSHEFRTPLAIIDTSAQRIAKHPQADSAATLERCRNVREATRRMTRLIDEFLSLDRVEGDLRPLMLTDEDPRRLVDLAVAQWEPGRVQTHCENLPDVFRCDQDLLGIAINNLIANALRHSQDDEPVRLEVLGTPTGIEIAVTDSGAGIAADELPKLFQKYFRGRNAQDKPGAGLGLYLVERIVSQHGGTVRAENQPGGGSRFTIVLPFATTATA